jgi:crotonobetainyl-CoA:carnitine CoA-transferase CaiB-like acyl-CoA transferase
LVLALFRRGTSGHGQRVWLTLAGTSALAQSEELMQVEGRQPAILGGRDFPGPGPLDRSYATEDGWIRLQATDSTSARALEATLGLAEGSDASAWSGWLPPSPP